MQLCRDVGFLPTLVLIQDVALANTEAPSSRRAGSAGPDFSAGADASITPAQLVALEVGVVRLNRGAEGPRSREAKARGRSYESGTNT